MKAYSAARDAGCDAFIFTDGVNRRYLSGFSSSDGVLVVTDEGGRLLLDSRYIEMAQRRFEAKMMRESVTPISTKKGLLAALADEVAANNIKSAAVDPKKMTLAEHRAFSDYLGIELVPLGGVIENMRRVKSNEELENIRAAQQLTEEAFSHILGFITPDVTETETAAELEHYIRRRGGTLAFDTICVSGINSSLPHGVPANVKLGKGFLTMDFGAAWNGYCSDMTRTVCIGQPTDEMKRVYDTVLEAQLTALDGIKAGVTGAQADSLARDVITDAGYGEFFGHSLGHSLGLEIHEAPNFSPSNELVIEAGTVMSVEPGIYIPGRFGVRIEDIVVLTEQGCEDLTRAPKELICL